MGGEERIRFATTADSGRGLSRLGNKEADGTAAPAPWHDVLQASSSLHGKRRRIGSHINAGGQPVPGDGSPDLRRAPAGPLLFSEPSGVKLLLGCRHGCDEGVGAEERESGCQRNINRRISAQRGVRGSRDLSAHQTVARTAAAIFVFKVSASLAAERGSRARCSCDDGRRRPREHRGMGSDSQNTKQPSSGQRPAAGETLPSQQPSDF